MRVFLGLGSNLNAEENIRCGLEALSVRLQVQQVSPWYQSPARGFRGPDFINLVVELAYEGTLDDLAKELRAIEFDCGREINAQKYTSRTLDIDILLFGNWVGLWPGGAIPRADVRNYAYVLKPLLDIYPEAVDPATGQPLAALWPLLSQQPLTRSP